MSYHTELELPVRVEYEHQPPEPMERHYPGCDETVTLLSAWLGEVEVTGYLSPMQIANLEQDILEHEQGMAADYEEGRADYEYERRRDDESDYRN